MVKVERETLKVYFKPESIPTGEQFAELIDSVPNLVDDPLVVKGDKGFAVYSPTDSEVFLEFYKKDINEDKPIWSFIIDNKTNALHFVNRLGKSVEEFTQRDSSESQESAGDTEKLCVDNICHYSEGVDHITMKDPVAFEKDITIDKIKARGNAGITIESDLNMEKNTLKVMKIKVGKINEQIMGKLIAIAVVTCAFGGAIFFLSAVFAAMYFCNK